MEGTSPPPAAEERRLRSFELALVLSAAFLQSTIYSLFAWWTGPGHRWMGETSAGSLERLAGVAVSLSLLVYVLSRRSRSLAEIGLTFRVSDFLWTIPLWFFSEISRGLVHLLVDPMFGAYPPEKKLAAGWITWLTILPATAEEELVVRAFLMSEIDELMGSTGLAVVASVGLQTVYHLYQGTAAAMVHMGPFLVAALFYAATRRITPVILVHALFNFRVLAF